MKKLPQLLLSVAGAFLLTVLSGCSLVDWIIKSPPRHVPAELVQFTPSKTARAVWSVSVGSAENYVFVPAYTTDAIYAASAGGDVVKVEPDTGAVLWRKDVGMDLICGVGSDGGTVVVIGTKGMIIALNSMGEEKWRAQASSEILTPPLVANGLVVVRSVDNRIDAYDADSGDRRWRVNYRLPSLMLRSAPGIATVGPTVLVGLPNGRMLSMMMDTGAIRWEIPIGEPRGATELERLADMTGVPAVSGQGVCVTSYHGRLGCFNVVTGAPFWIKEFSSKVGVSIDEEHVYAVDTSDRLSAFNNMRGQSDWRNDKMTYRDLSTPVPYQSTVVVGDGKGVVHFLSKYDGSFEARAETDGTPIAAAPLIYSDKVLVQTKGGKLVAFTLETAVVE